MRVIEKGIACENTVHRRTRPRRDSLRMHRRTAGDASVSLPRFPARVGAARALRQLEEATAVRAVGRGRSRRWLAPALGGFATNLLLPGALPIE